MHLWWICTNKLKQRQDLCLVLEGFLGGLIFFSNFLAFVVRQNCTSALTLQFFLAASTAPNLSLHRSFSSASLLQKCVTTIFVEFH
jgi:hypothetical protein